MCASYLEEKQISHGRGKISDLICCKNGIYLPWKVRTKNTESSVWRSSSVKCPMHPNLAAEDVYGGGGRRCSDSGVILAAKRLRQ